MRVARVRLRDFRNYERAELELGEGLTVVCGPNASGKTNLLEALYLGCTARSWRTSSRRELVRFGAPAARVELDVVGDDGVEHALEVGVEAGDAQSVRVDGSALERPDRRAARPLVSVFVPDRVELVRGGPRARRAHLDDLVAALWPARAEARVAYGRALAQRNALLARIRAGAARADLLDPWDVELARWGARVVADREAATALTAPAVHARAAELGLARGLELTYRARSAARDADGLRAELAERREADVARGFTAHGPHRDDLAFIHAGRPLRAFGSRGEQRVALLALLFAERDTLLEQRRSAPLMLLDEVMSELDPERRGRLAELVRSGGQAVVTATDAEHVPGANGADVILASVSDGVLSVSPRPVAV